MNKYMSNVNNLVKFVFVFAIIGAFFVCLGMSYAYVGNESYAVSGLSNNLTYNLTIDDLSNTTLSIEPNEIKKIDVKLASDNEISTKYKLYYDELTSNSDIDVSYVSSYDDNIIESKEEVKLALLIKNNSNQTGYIELKVIGGLVNNELLVPSGIEIK